jgi:hypothetical protein
MIAVWKDPDFDPNQRAFYYASVIEIPTPRWTTYEAKRFNIDMPDHEGARLHVAHLVHTAGVKARRSGVQRMSALGHERPSYPG